MTAFRTLWTALVGLYEETLLLLAGNLLAIALNLPIGLLLVLVGLPLASNADDPSTTQLLILLIGGLMPFLPTPGNIALAGLTRVAAGPDAPHLTHFTSALRSRWRLALRCSVLSVAVMVAVALNVAFYPLRFGLGGWALFVSIFWLYAGLFWLSLHIYLLPLAVHVAEPRVFDLYRRSAFVALGHPGYTLLLLLILLIFAFAAAVFLPVYLLVGPALISLVQAHALREIRRRHGDLVVGAEEEVSRL